MYWSWWWITSPLWIYQGFYLLGFIIIFIATYIVEKRLRDKAKDLLSIKELSDNIQNDLNKLKNKN